MLDISAQRFRWSERLGVADESVRTERHPQPPRETMKPRLDIALSTLVVPDYDMAIDYFVNTLGFHLREDSRLDDGKRWVVVCPAKTASHGLLLAVAATEQQRERIGNQTGGRVAFFLTTDDFETTYADFVARGVEFCEAPRDEAYGLVVVFTDLFGNRWDLIQPRS